MDLNPNEYPHRRYNPLEDQWVLVSPHRTKRPWQGQVEDLPPSTRPRYDPRCYLCPGNERAGGLVNPAYEGTFVFRNDFSALLAEPGPEYDEGHPLLRRATTSGECRVVCFSPRHDLALPQMPVADLERVVRVWRDQVADLGERYRWVQVFENKGAVMGCSNPHPHGQVWAGDALPTLPAREDACQALHQAASGRSLLHEYMQEEVRRGERIVTRTAHWAAVVPYWATWPYETLLAPLAPVQRITELAPEQCGDLALALLDLLGRYDRLFGVPFPYSMGWHGAPTGPAARRGDSPHWQLHAHAYPPLLRSATVRKFMVGYEMLAEPQRDITAEMAAATLRAV